MGTSFLVSVKPAEIQTSPEALRLRLENIADNERLPFKEAFLSD